MACLTFTDLCWGESAKQQESQLGAHVSRQDGGIIAGGLGQSGSCNGCEDESDCRHASHCADLDDYMYELLKVIERRWKVYCDVKC